MVLADARRLARRASVWLSSRGLRRRSARRAGLVADLSEALALSADRDRLAALLEEDLPAILGYSGGRLYLAGEDASSLAPARPAEEGGGALPLDAPLARRLAERGGPELLDALADAHPAVGAALARDGAVLVLPLVADGAVQGLLCLGPRTRGGAPRAGDLAVLGALGHQAALAAHSVRLIEALRAEREGLARANAALLVARHEERRRLARELHDGALQDVLGLRYRLAEWQAASPDDAGALAGRAEAVREALRRIAERLRGTVRDLRPAGPAAEGLVPTGLAAALDGAAARIAEEFPGRLPPVTLSIPPGLRLPLAVEVCLFRAAQEALRNAARHAGARRVAVRVEEGGDRVVLAVEDDGCGFAPPERLGDLAQGAHYGLAGLEERVAGLGGRLAVASRPGSGTRLTVTLPAEPQEEPHA